MKHLIRNLMMNRQSKGLITLLVTLLIGFILGFLVGGGCTRRAMRSAVIEDEENADEVAQIVQQARLRPSLNLRQTARLSPGKSSTTARGSRIPNSSTI